MASEADKDDGAEGLDEPLPLIRVGSMTIKGRGLLHDFVPCQDSDAGKRCVVDGFPNSGVMRFMGPHSDIAPQASGPARCIVQVENPHGEDSVLIEKGLLVKQKKVKVAPDETIVSGYLSKRGQTLKNWRKRFAVLYGDGCFRYYTDDSRKKLKGAIDVRRDCTGILTDHPDASWPQSSTAETQICVQIQSRIYYLVCNSTEDAQKWMQGLTWVARRLKRRTTLERSADKAAGKTVVPTHVLSPQEKAKADSTKGGGKGGKGGKAGTLPSNSPTTTLAEKIRVRRHMFREVVVNGYQKCQGCTKKIGVRVRHSICTQCRFRFHNTCLPVKHASCTPPPFGTPAAVKRVAPPLGSNLAAAVAWSSTSGTVPGFVEDLIHVLDTRGLDTEGVFRVPGHKDRTAQVIEHFFSDERRARIGVNTIKEVHDCSSALKKFLRELDEPLLTYTHYNQLMDATKMPDVAERTASLERTLSDIPLFNLATLKALMEHLRRIAAAQEKTRMKFSNLAAIFAPTLLQSPDGDDVNFRDVCLQMKCVLVMLELPEALWASCEAAALKHNRRSAPSPCSQRRNTSPQTANTRKHSVPPLDMSGGGAGLDVEEDMTATPMSPPSAADSGDVFGSLEISDNGNPRSVRRTNPMYHSTIEDSPASPLRGSGNDGAIASSVSSVAEEDHDFDGFESFNPADVVEGENAESLMPGFEMFHLDDGEAATVTLTTKARRKPGNRSAPNTM